MTDSYPVLSDWGENYQLLRILTKPTRLHFRSCKRWLILLFHTLQPNADIRDVCYDNRKRHAGRCKDGAENIGNEDFFAHLSGVEDGTLRTIVMPPAGFEPTNQGSRLLTTDISFLQNFAHRI